MSKFVKYKLKDGRRIRCRCSHDTDKVLISLDDFERLLNESDVAYEQVKQLQTIIENLQEIKVEAVREALDKIKAEIIDKSYLSYDDNPRRIIDESWVLEIIDKYKTESEG